MVASMGMVTGAAGRVVEDGCGLLSASVGRTSAEAPLPTRNVVVLVGACVHGLLTRQQQIPRNMT